MIVEMKRIHVIVQQSARQSALLALRDFGEVHVEPLREFKDTELASLAVNSERLASALNAIKLEAKDTAQEECGDVQPIVDDVLEKLDTIQRLEESIEQRAARMKNWEPWGEFDPKDIRDLAKKGLFIHLYEIPVKEQPELPEGSILKEVSIAGGVKRCVVVMRENIQLPFERIYPPMISMKEKRVLQKEEAAQVSEAKASIAAYGKYLQALEQALHDTLEELKFKEVTVGMETAESFAVLKGYCPAARVDALQDKAKSEHWGLLIEDVDENDVVPTMLDNPKWVKLAKPALDMIEILPGYREVDVSAVFLIFFTLFFAMLIGDAAYGLIFLIGAVFLQQKFKNKLDDQTPFHLLYLLTGFTCIWGILTGTYFGQQWLPSTVKPVVPWLNEEANIQWLCFTVALVHLNIARLWRIKRLFPDLRFISEIGWLMIVWGMYYLANLFVLDKPFPEFAGWLFMIGIPLALLFMVPFKEFLKKVPQEIIPFVLSVIGAGTDIISYIRLFAVGLATVAVADAANFMPEALPALGIGYAFMVLLHVINLILALMAILVHAVRLNVLEFSGHLSLEWSGIPYSPFKKSKIA